MQYPKLLSPGCVEIQHNGHVRIYGFETKDASCRQAVQLAIVWAQQKLARALEESLTADLPRLTSID